MADINLTRMTKKEMASIAFDMRALGMDWVDIGAELGISPNYAREIVIELIEEERNT